jgi:hypothetical protein
MTGRCGMVLMGFDELNSKWYACVQLANAGFLTRGERNG